ncbi:MAG: ZIP family metal transporter [Anaerolineales bacterium]|nr:ZIP family metal transporter [Anaerolineales bacterium]
MIELNGVLNVVLLSLVAGLGTGLGGLLAIIRRPGRRSFGFLMGITAGVMICLSFLELVNEAWQLQGYLTATIGFTLGAMFMFLLDYFIPHIRFGEREIEPKSLHLHLDASQPKPPPQGGQRLLSHFHHRYPRRGRKLTEVVDSKLLKTGMLIAIGITLHNLPEGIAVGAGYMHQPRFGYFIALAIMLHNIPEGIATALPLCKGGACRSDALRVAFLSGMAEPVGALAAALFLKSFQSLIPGALAFAGGVMVFITLDELIPVAREHGHQHWTALGIICGSIFVFLLSGLMGV